MEAEVLSGKDALASICTKILVAAMEPRHFIRHLDTDKSLVITPGDRHDILTTLACAQNSSKHRSVSGVVLTGGIKLDEEIMNLVNEASNNSLPIISVKTDTFTTAARIGNVNTGIRPQDRDKIDTAKSAIASNVEPEKLWESLKMPRQPRQKSGSGAFLEKIIEQAKASGKRIVLPEATNPARSRLWRRSWSSNMPDRFARQRRDHPQSSQRARRQTGRRPGDQ